jgi:hypothetical protein
LYWPSRSILSRPASVDSSSQNAPHFGVSFLQYHRVERESRRNILSQRALKKIGESLSGAMEKCDLGEFVYQTRTDRLKVTHPDRPKVTHLVFEDGRSGQERQLGFQADFRPFLDFIDSRKR